MANSSTCWGSMVCLPAAPHYYNSSNHHLCNITTTRGIDEHETRMRSVAIFAAKPGGFASILDGCKTCKGQGAIECPGCKGTGRNKKNGNIFERWKCYDCQGFGLKGCPGCGKGGLTPEQRGER